MTSHVKEYAAREADRLTAWYGRPVGDLTEAEISVVVVLHAQWSGRSKRLTDK